MTAGCYPKGWIGAQKLYLDPQETPFLVGPYLVRVADDAAAIVVQHPCDAPEIEYGPVGTATGTWTRRVRMTVRDGRHIAVLDGLPHDQMIEYRIVSDDGVFGPARFIAGRSRGSKFRFAAFGDTRTGHRVHRALIESMAREEIDFVVHSGDLVEFGGRDEQWTLFWQIEQPVASRRFVFAAVGNHDDSPRGNFRRWFLTSLWNRDRRYFVQDWGDLRVVIMDSEIEFRPGSEQYKFIEAALADGAKRGMLMLMSLHYPPYSSGKHGSDLEAREVVAELAPRFGVELVLAGHDHNYERTQAIDGVTYIVAASGGANIRPISPQKFSAVLRTEPHYVLFDVEPSGLVGRTVNLAGNTFDTFVIKALAPRARP